MAATTRSIKVYVFSIPEPVVINLPSASLSPTAAQIKKIVGMHLGLNERSLKIFGIFTGQLGCPKSLIDEHQSLSRCTTSLCFQRLSFDCDLELSITREDNNALKILFGELSHEYNRFKVLPVPIFSEMKLMDSILASESLFGEKDKFVKQKEFYNFVCSLTRYYWGYYYRAESCTLLNSTLPASSMAEQGMKVHVIITLRNLILLEPVPVNGKELLSLSWFSVCSVKMVKYPKMQLKIEAIISNKIDDEQEKEFVQISLETKQNEYIYTMVQHIFKLLESKMSGGLLRPPVSIAMARAEINPNNDYCCINAAFSKIQ